LQRQIKPRIVMKKYLLIGLLMRMGLPTMAQHPVVGHIQYEVSRRLDAPKIIGLDGTELKPGSPGYPEGLPDVISSGLTLAFDAAYAREDEEEPSVVLEGGTEIRSEQAPTRHREIDQAALRPTFSERIYTDLANRRQICILTVGTGAEAKRYRTDTPYATPTDWHETGRQKTIAGQRCREAKATHQGTAYTVWFTTDLPFTYSPTCAVAPPQGVVLWLESGKGQYRATRIDAKGETDLAPSAEAQLISADELAEIKAKAEADFMRRVVDEAQK
jgi:hypothetical protein